MKLSQPTIYVWHILWNKYLLLIFTERVTMKACMDHRLTPIHTFLIFFDLIETDFMIVNFWVFNRILFLLFFFWISIHWVYALLYSLYTSSSSLNIIWYIQWKGISSYLASSLNFFFFKKINIIYVLLLVCVYYIHIHVKQTL